MKMNKVYTIIRKTRESVLKAMQERGIKELKTILPYKDWCKEHGKEPEDDEDDDEEYQDYKDQEAPYVVFYLKYSMDDYRIDKVTLECNRFKFEGYSNECGYDWSWEEDTVWATRMFVWERMSELLKIEEEPNYIWVLFSESLYDYEVVRRAINVFDNEDEARKAFAKEVKEARKCAVTNEWEIGNDSDNFFEAYPQGSFGTSHETVELNRTIMNNNVVCKSIL